MRTIIKKEFRAERWKYIIFTALLLILAITIVMQYPFVKNILKQGVLEGMPEWMVRKARAQINFPIYLAANWYDKNLMQMTVVFAILFGMSVFSKEIEDHTIEFLLARPLSRTKLFFEKTGLQLLTILLIMFLTTLILGITAIVQNYEINFFRLIIGIFPVLSKFLIIYSLALLLSLYLDDQVKTGIITAVILIAVWASSFVNSISKVNLFIYAKVTPYYFMGDFPMSTIVLYLLGFILYGLAFYRFKRRDF